MAGNFIDRKVNIWNEKKRTVEAVDFRITINPSAIPASVYIRAAGSKGGKAKLAHGCVIVEVRKPK